MSTAAAGAQTLRGALLICSAMTLFTLNDVMLKFAGAGMPIGQLMVLRGIVGGLMLLGIGWWSREPWHWRGILHPFVLIRAFCDAAASLLFVHALMVMPIATVTALIQSVPVLATLAGVLVFRDLLPVRQWVALAICMIGVLAITNIAAVSADASLLSAGGAAAMMVLRDLVTRGTAHTIPSTWIALVSTLALPLISIPDLLGSGWVAIGGGDWLLIAGTGICVCIGNLLLISAMRLASLGTIAPFRYSAVVISIAFGYLFWREVPAANEVLGSALIVLGGLISGNLLRPAKRA
jgi:drug/metabolite transporter (DMT)-like permease